MRRVHDFNTKYEIQKCVNWIKENSYKKVCLQFPSDILLADAVQIALAIEKEVQEKLFILCGSSFAGCCIDYSTAKHVNADSVIHFGNACLNPFNRIPSLFVLPKEQFDVTAFLHCVRDLVEEHSHSHVVVLLYDVAFSHYTDEIIEKLSAYRHRNKVFLSSLMLPLPPSTNTIDGPSLTTSTTIVTEHGRRYCVPHSVAKSNILYVYIKSSNDLSSEKNFDNFLLSSPDSTFYSYKEAAVPAPQHNKLIVEKASKATIKKKLFEIEKVKEAKKIGIIIATVSIDSFLEAVERIKRLCKIKGKKCYLICVGKPNETKLANFPQLDVLVLLSCNESCIDKKQYFQPIVSMMELEIALNSYQTWTGKVITDFRQYLNGGTEYKEINAAADDGSNETDVSLISGKLLLSSSSGGGDFQKSEISDDNTKSLLLPAQNSAATVVLGSGTNAIERTWNGLHYECTDIPVNEVTTGRKGTPSSGYKHQFSNGLT